MDFTKPWACSALSVGLFALITGCKSAPTPERNSPAPKIALQPERIEPSENSTSEDCGLKDYPVSRSNQEILSGVPRDDKHPNSDMFAKIAIDKDGKITHLRVLRLAHSNAPNWKEINEAALADVKKWHSKPTFYQGKPVAVCSDVSVVVDLF
jgi:hypothetical protein